MTYLFLLVGPSGVGKKTLINRVCTLIPNLKKIKLYTCSRPRPHDNQSDYCFISSSQLLRMIKDATVEYTVLNDRTFCIRHEDINDSSCSRIVPVDVEAAKKIKVCVGNGCKIIFVNCRYPQTTLRQRLKYRGENDEYVDNMDPKSKDMMKFFHHNPSFFDGEIVNTNLQNASQELETKIREFQQN